MKLLGFVSCVCFYASGALASLGAGPYQTVAYWYAYRMDIQANSQGGNLIAAGCKGTVQDGSCNFNEFLKHISPGSPGTITSIIGTDLDPDVDTAVKALQNSGYNYAADQRLLLPSLFPPNETKEEKKIKKPFGEIWKGTGDVINTCRTKLGDVNMGSKLDQVRYCMTMVHLARQSEQAKGVIDRVNKYLLKELKLTTFDFQYVASNLLIHNFGTKLFEYNREVLNFTFWHAGGANIYKKSELVESLHGAYYNNRSVSCYAVATVFSFLKDVLVALWHRTLLQIADARERDTERCCDPRLGSAYANTMQRC
ncbi:hypothetical protein LTR37_011654 [Vermiconidia calcicola]|uniref:Uncharacterized protein n=1 Tax=Vermiconidia calcicola TaxID=1690605 RepID=A0ACC3N1G5_9PEZI|nr:hypothetical protein LTR37_011654 [Vermiconidia calcicola]